MTGSDFATVRRIALDRGQSHELRSGAIAELTLFRTREVVEVLLEIASTPAESDVTSRTAGTALASYLTDGLVTAWDVRDLTQSAAEAFHE